MKNLANDGTHRGATSAPTVVPELNIAVAKALSFFGKYSAVTFTAAGKLPASPAASTMRAAMKKYTLTMAIVEAVAPAAPTICAAPSSPTTVSVAQPQRACRHAPADHTPMATR